MYKTVYGVDYETVLYEERCRNGNMEPEEMTAEQLANLVLLTRQRDRAASALQGVLEEIFPPGAEIHWRIHGEPGHGVAIEVSGSTVRAQDEFCNLVEIDAAFIVPAPRL